MIMRYDDDCVCEQLEPYLVRLQEELLPLFQEKLDDYSLETQQRYIAYLRYRYYRSMLHGLYEIDGTVQWPDDRQSLDEKLEHNYNLCYWSETQSLDTPLTDLLRRRLDIPIRTEKDDHAVARFNHFVSTAASLILATILGKVKPNPSELDKQLRRFSEYTDAISDYQWRTHPMITKSPFAISDTIMNLCCAYGKEPLWKAPVYRNLSEAGPVDENTYYGQINMNDVREVFFGEDFRLPDDEQWEQAQRNNDEQLLYGDWHSSHPRDIQRAWERYEELKQQDESK